MNFFKFKRYNRVFILPTKFGSIYLLMVFIMLIAGAAYNNNLVNLFAYFLASVAFICMFQTNDNLKSIEVKQVEMSSGFSDSTLKLVVNLYNSSKKPKFNIQAQFTDLINIEQLEMNQPLLSKSQTRVISIYESPKRGHYQIKEIKISTIYPLGLFYSWMYQTCDHDFYVYPKPNGTQKIPPPQFQYQNTSPNSKNNQMGEDFSEHRNFIKGDSPHHLNWKAFARGRGLLVKEFKTGASQFLLLSINDCKQDFTEEKLEQLSQWVEYCRRQDLSFALNLGDKKFSAQKGSQHIQKCLKALAQYKDQDSI